MLKRRIWLMAVLACTGIHAAAIVAQGQGCETIPDCNRNGEDDACDISCSNSGEFCSGGSAANAMCNSGYFPSCGGSLDCDADGIPDECYLNRSDWDHPCEASPGTTLVCDVPEGLPPEKCRCEADWDTATNWTGGVPDTCTEEVRFFHSNATVGFCDGGKFDGAPCTVPTNCGLGTCILEESLIVDLATADTNPKMVVMARINLGITDSLVLTITGATATFGEVVLDGINGPVTLSGEVKTN